METQSHRPVLKNWPGNLREMRGISCHTDARAAGTSSVYNRTCPQARSRHEKRSRKRVQEEGGEHEKNDHVGRMRFVVQMPSCSIVTLSAVPTSQLQHASAPCNRGVAGGRRVCGIAVGKGRGWMRRGESRDTEVVRAQEQGRRSLPALKGFKAVITMAYCQSRTTQAVSRRLQNHGCALENVFVRVFKDDAGSTDGGAV